MAFGVNYTAVVGAKPYVDWATFSAKTVKQHMPDVRTSVYTNVPDLVKESKWGEFVDDILKAPDYAMVDCQGAMIDGILASEQLGYDVTLFTGATTVFCGNVLDKMELMATGKFDLALTMPADQRKRRYPLRGVHPGFSYYRDGILIFPWNDAIRAFMTDWRDLYRSHRKECARSRKAGSRYHPTMPALNEALYRHSNLRLVFLPENYCMTFWTGCLYGRALVMAIHGSDGPHTWKLAKRLNKNSDKPRLFWDRRIL
jgi:hypothetical protein